MISYAVISHVGSFPRVEDSSRNYVTKIFQISFIPYTFFYIFFRFFKICITKGGFAVRVLTLTRRASYEKYMVLAKILWIHSGKRMSVRSFIINDGFQRRHHASSFARFVGITEWIKSGLSCVIPSIH